MKKLLYAIYPFLIACYPVLALRNYNIIYVDFASIFRTLLVVITITITIWLVLYILFRDWAKSGVVTGLTMIMIMSYGHIHTQSAALFGEPIRHTYLIVFLAALYFVFVWLTKRSAAFVDTSRNFLVITSVVLFVMNLGQSLYYDYGTYQASKLLSSQDQQVEQSESSSQLPDVYLIILDAHGRQDVLKNNFGYDNSAFLQTLQNLGFYVASCSQSNYASTNLSLSSLFSMNYLPKDLGITAKLPPLKETILSKTLVSLGYTVIAFENRASGHFDLKEDIHLSRNQFGLGKLNLSGGINEFEEVMFHTSIINFFLDTRIIPGFNEDSLIQLQNYEHYQQTKFILSKLADLPKMRGPKFVFAHIMVPHDPYIFTVDGKFKRLEDKSKDGYRDNAEYIDQGILTSIKAIVAESERPPIIVLMGDHGPPPGKFATREDRMKNLDAYFVNSETAADLYASITPVNSFRIIFNHYLGESNPLRDDVSYYAYKIKQLRKADVMENTCTATK